MLIDIYRYQTVTDWQAVKRHGVTGVYVKASDGGGLAVVRADGQVRGAQSVGIPVGLYHYAQLTPSPEVQADILTREVHRLGATGLPPALDLEGDFRPDAQAGNFAARFLARLSLNGFGVVTLYANTSMLNGINAQSFDDDPNTVIWAASYGPNDGRRHALNYSGRVHIHQYTSVGTVPGISGRVDLNEVLIDIPGDDMPTAEEIAKAVWDHARPQLDDPAKVLPMWIWTVGANMGAWRPQPDTMPDVDEQQIVAGLTGPLAAALTEALDKHGPADPQKVAEAVALRLYRGAASQDGEQ